MPDGRDAFSANSRRQSLSTHHPQLFVYIELRFKLLGRTGPPEFLECAVNQLIQEEILSGGLFTCQDKAKLMAGIVIADPDPLTFWI